MEIEDFTIDQNGVLLSVDDSRLGENPLVIPEGVTAIGEEIFGGFRSPCAIYCPDSLEVIEKRAFYEAVDLYEIHLGNGLKTIECEAFYHTWVLKEIILPDSVTYLGERAFAGGSPFQKVTLSKRLTHLPHELLAGRSVHTPIDIPFSVRTTGENVFHDNQEVRIEQACECVQRDLLEWQGAKVIVKPRK